MTVHARNAERAKAVAELAHGHAGEFPPATLASDEAVVRFVAANANAIGYLVGTDGGSSVAVVLVLGDRASLRSGSEAVPAP